MIMNRIQTQYPASMLAEQNQETRFAALRYVLSQDKSDVLKAIEKTGLIGRSGVGRPVADKWQLCQSQSADNKIVLVNGIDSDPLLPAASILLDQAPDRVIEGMLIAAFIVGANQGIICLDETDDEQKARIEAYLKALVDEGILGDKVLGSDFSFKVGVGGLPAKYVCREDTALIAGLSGKPTMSVLTPPMPEQSGFESRPTLVHAAQTLSQIATICAQLAEGGEVSQTQLVAVSGAVKQDGYAELPLGISVQDVIEKVGGGLADGTELKFVQAGGSAGSILTGEELDLKLDYDSFVQSGRILGTASVIVCDSKTCVVDFVKDAQRAMNQASCGKCVMGREGTWQLQEFTHDMTTGKSKIDDPKMLKELAEGIRDGAMCSVCKAAGLPVKSAMERFADEFELHMRRKKCTTMVCKKYVTFHILPDKCTGCTDCLNKCPVDAIAGGEGLIHVIDQDLCNNCGICEEICKPGADAITRAGAVKPKTPETPVPVGSFAGKSGLGGLRKRRRK